MNIKVNENTVIVFDLDDTLYNEIGFLRSAYIAIAKKLDFENWQYLFSTMFSLYRSNEDVFKWMAANYGTEKEELIHAYRNHQPNINLFNGALDLFRTMKKKKGKIGIITDGRTSTQKAKIKALGITEFIDYTIISEEIGSEKPNDLNYKLMENTFKSHSYFYIADNFRKDFVTPNKLGWQTIGILDNGLNIHFDSHKYDAKTFAPQKLVYELKEINIV